MSNSRIPIVADQEGESVVEACKEVRMKRRSSLGLFGLGVMMLALTGPGV
jgi:hypothetical protein